VTYETEQQSDGRGQQQPGQHQAKPGRRAAVNPTVW